MKLNNTLNIDSWWKLLLICGIALVALGLLFKIDIVNRKHLIGLEIGFFIIGIANWMALKTVVQKYNTQGFFYGKTPIHNKATKAMQMIGHIISAFFICMLLWELI